MSETEITNDAAERTNSIKPGAFSLHRVCGPVIGPRGMGCPCAAISNDRKSIFAAGQETP